jgi:hypothetical protein
MHTSKTTSLSLQPRELDEATTRRLTKKAFVNKTLGLAGSLFLATVAAAQTYSIDTFTIAGGSGTISGGIYSLSGTVGQPDGNLELSGGNFAMSGGFWSIAAAGPTETTLIVPGTANPWLAGMTNGFHEASGDVTPNESPVLFTNFTAGTWLQFAASGSASYGGAASGPAGTDGFFVNHPAEDGIGAIANSLANALIGVFLDDAQPDPSVLTPDPLDFGTDRQNYVVLRPALKQPFYIGSGTNASGLQQYVVAPAGATRLYLGIQDGFGWYNNTGSFTVTVGHASGTESGMASFDRNLILNPGAELGPASVSGNDLLPVPNWIISGNFTVVAYDSSFAAPGPVFGGNFFSGGPATRSDASNPSSTATQIIDLSALATHIDTGAVAAELSGYFGGYGEQNDRASLRATYLDGSGNQLGNLSIGNVLAVDRTNHTALLFRGGTNAVPAGTRTVQLVLAMTNDSGFYYNDGYADNLSLVLRAPGAESGGIVIFDNTFGSDNGGGGVTESAWLAGKFCLGSQGYSLDSVGVLLDSQDFSGAAEPPASVRLQIYYSDPAHTNKPGVSTGAMMDLVGRTNPITLLNGYEVVMWTPRAPASLLPNTCYWAVLSGDTVGRMGAIGTFTKPAGVAGSYGISRSVDAGANWGGADESSNFKMIIRGTPASPAASLPETAADNSTPIPGGTGGFTSLPTAPSLSGDTLAFFGAGTGGQQGIYSTTRGSPQSPTRIIDLNTPIPSGTGNFLSFGTDAGIIIVGGDVLFSARGVGGQQGIYLSSHATPGELLRIADTTMTIPDGVGIFTGFQNALGFSGTDVAFVGSGSAAQQGLYRVAAISPPQVGSPFRLADTTTPIPDGNGNFTGFPAGPAISGSDVAFIGNGSGAQQGLYRVAAISPPQVGSRLRIADTTTAIPGGSGNFTSFGSDQANPVDPAMSGDRLAFVGSGSGGQQGVYSVSLAAPQAGSPLRVADTATPIPGGSGNFASFSAVSESDTDVAFLGHGSGSQTGIYDMTGGQLRKVIAVGDAIQGKTIAGLNFSRDGLFGDPIAFQATFNDGSQGIYTIDVPPPQMEPHIIALERSGPDLRLSFTSVAGQNYAIQARADLSSGTWTTLSGTRTSGDGNTVQVTLLNALGQPQQFYRVMIVP